MAIGTVGVCLSIIVGYVPGGIFRLPDPTVVYVAFGDSLTKGPTRSDYAAFLPALLGEAPNRFTNEGNSGEPSGQGLARLRSLVDRGLFPNAKSLLYWEGGNDLIDWVEQIDPCLMRSPDNADYPYARLLEPRLDEIQANVEAAIQLGTDAGWRVYVATYYFLPSCGLKGDPLVPDALPPRKADNANAYVRKLNERIRRAARNRGAVLVDIAARDFELRVSPGNYLDRNHLSAQGNQIVARIFAEAIGR